jgi:hypothetical protein
MGNSSNHSNHHHPWTWIKATLFVLLLIALGLFVWWAEPKELYDPDRIANFLQEAGWWAPQAYIL